MARELARRAKEKVKSKREKGQTGATTHLRGFPLFSGRPAGPRVLFVLLRHVPEMNQTKDFAAPLT